MGRRALSAQERADKAARERDRSRRYRLAARQNDSTHPDNNSHPHTISSDLSNLPGNPLTEIAQEESSIFSHNNEQHNDITLHHDVGDQPASGVFRRSRTPPLVRSITTTHDPIIQVDKTTLQPDASTQSIGQHTHPNTIYITAQCPGTANYQDTATIDNKVESVLAVEASSLSHPIQNKQQVIPRPGRPQKDPALSPRERTRLRVQRHRDQQHLTKAQQIVEQFDITQELPPTVEFSGLTLHDDLASSVSPDGDQSEPDCRPDSEPDPESEAEPILFSSSPRDLTAYIEDEYNGDISENSRFANNVVSDPSILVRPSSTGSTRHNSQSPQHRNSASSSTPSPPASLPSPLSSPSSIPSVGRDESILSGYLQAINEQDTAGGPDFLRQQGDIYNRILRTFFNHQCNCSSPHNLTELGNTHTLQEHTEHISHFLPPLPSIFANRDQACDPHVSFPQWQSFLSDQPPEPLSLHKTQASLPHGSVTVARQWDVDSIWFGAKSLSAIQAPSHFRLSFFPAYKSNISTAQVIQPHGLDLAHTRHTSIGTFITAGVRFSVLLFFPNGGPSHTKASANSLSLERFKDLYDEIILPAIYETLPDHVRQEIPSSYDLLYAKSRAYQEKPGAGRWSAEDESRTFRLSYSIPAINLPDFWASVVERANLHRVQTRRGDAVPYFQNPRLLFQAHDLKNTFASQSLGESLALFRDMVLAGLDASQIDMHSCWLDVGMRDHVRPPSSPTLANGDGIDTKPWTLLWKSACCDHLHDQLGGIAPEAPLVAHHYRSYLLRDVGTYYAKAKPSRASNPGHPEARSPGIIRAKAYNCSKDLFGVMFSDYQLFSSGLLPLLAFDEEMLKDLAATDQNRQRAFVSQLNRSHLVDAWEANKRHMRAIATLKRYPNFGTRKEVTLRLDVILAMWADGMLDPDQNPHTGPVCWNVPLTSSASDQHCPFWVLPTETVVKFVSTQAARFVLPLDHIFSQASKQVARPLSSSSSSPDPIQQILGFYTAQLLCRLLIHSADDEQEYGFDNWIWRPTWTVRTRGRGPRPLKQRRGLGLGDIIDTSGTLWILGGHFNWQRGHIGLEVLIDLYISRNPLQAKLARQSNVQALTTNQVTIELRFQQLTSKARIEYGQGHSEDAERLADRAITLAVQEIARAYHQHFLAKLHSYWDRTRGQFGRQRLPVLNLLKQAQEESAAETGRIPTAQTIHGVYAEAWAEYCKVMTEDVDEDDRSDINMSSSSSSQSALPEELPCWMTTRRRLPPKNSWSDFLFQQIFCRAKPPTWNALFFLQLYRGFKEVWEKTCAPLGPFDSRFSRHIGYYIQVAFNCDHSKEVGTSHSRTTWHHNKPPFFQIQYWAPYFSPPRTEENTPLSSVYRLREYPEGLSPYSTPFILTSREFGGIERAIWPHWVEIMHGVDGLRSSDRKTIQRHCRRALLYASYIAGPTWGRDDDVNFIQPWLLNQPSRTGGGIDEHIFRVPVAETHISRQILEETMSQPTIILPTRDNIIGLLDTMETLPGHSSTFLARLRWTRRRLNNQGDQYD
ncbi:hypothetical protein BFJ71_g17273, partial [Fusarium oxysporum]